MNGGARHDVGDRLGDMTGETLEDRRHAEGALAGENLSFERDVGIDPAVGEWSAEAVNVRHPSPREVRWPHQEVSDLLPGESKVAENLSPDGFLSGDREWGIDALQRHPVDHRLPIVPVPPRHRVGKRAVVEEVADAVRRDDVHGCRYWRQRVGQCDGRKRERRIHPGDVLQIPIERRGDGDTGGAAENDVRSFALDLEYVEACAVGHRGDFEPAGARRNHPGHEGPGGDEVYGMGSLNDQQRKNERRDHAAIYASPSSTKALSLAPAASHCAATWSRYCRAFSSRFMSRSQICSRPLRLCRTRPASPRA